MGEKNVLWRRRELKALWTQDRLGLDPLICIQNPYNLLNRELEREMWPAQRDQGFGVMTYSPLDVGLFSGVYTPGEPPPDGTLYATGRAGDLQRDLNEAARRTLEILREIAGAHGRTVAQTAINWELSHLEVTAAITGGDTVAHMEESAGAVGWSITPEDRGPSRRGLGGPGPRPGLTAVPHQGHRFPGVHAAVSDGRVQCEGGLGGVGRRKKRGAGTGCLVSPCPSSFTSTGERKRPRMHIFIESGSDLPSR